MRNISNVPAIAVAAACAMLTMAATASVHAETLTQSVSTRGLDLAVAADQAELRHRIAVASRQVCTQGDGSDFAGAVFRDCQHDAFQAAWAEAKVRITAARAGAMVASSK